MDPMDQDDLWDQILFSSGQWGPRKQFLCKKGVRKGDPLSHMIFVIAADVLQSMLNEALHNSVVESPLIHNSCPDCLIIQYADETILVAKVDVRQLHTYKISSTMLNTLDSKWITPSPFCFLPTHLHKKWLSYLTSLDARLVLPHTHILEYHYALPNLELLTLCLCQKELRAGYWVVQLRYHLEIN